ncbi:hypothetical protein RCL_jg15567.t2 [Rhizophagus clarus]|uniref:UvrD-like helicase C-terminal domain-containing protein n=1 Tax=Rhizophagus clarus TaxID=94130 RepID=A0A8H3QAS0_9GLOM|nr:hypothetical protein RCL_jg15567.t2 [Rhizophagus clarus]
MDVFKLLDDDDTNGQKWDDLLKQCLSASDSDLDEFLVKLSKKFDNYLPKLLIFTSYLCNKYLQVTLNVNLKWNILLAKFISKLITIVITKNLHKPDIFGVSVLLHNSIELLWWTSDKEKKTNLVFKIIKNVFSKIMEVNVLEVLISEIYGFRCLRRILFDFDVISQIEQIELLKAVDLVAALLEECPEHINVSSSEGFSIYKACTTLLETLINFMDDKEQYCNRKRNSLIQLSIKDQQHLELLGMTAPQKLSDLPHFLRALEQRKIDSFQDLIGFLPCISCHKRALNYFSPNKFPFEYELAPSECFRLPFEFNEDDNLGPWDILLGEDAIKDLQQLDSTPETINTIMDKLWQLSFGEWDKQCIAVRTSDETHLHVHNIIPVYETALPNNGPKILWQVDCGFTIRSNSFTQLVKIWAVTNNQEQINKMVKNLSIVHQVYTSKQRRWCIGQNIEGSKLLPTSLGDEVGTFKDRSYSSRTDDELLMIHEMLVTNKFVPLSTNLHMSLVLGGLNFTFQVSKEEYEIINYPMSAIIIGRSGTVRDSAMLSRKNMSMEQIYEYRKKKEEEGAFSPKMHEEEDEEKELNSIPDTFNHLQLTDDKFPLFITFDKFSKMLQGTYGISNQDLTIKKTSNADNNDSQNKKNNRKSSFINTEDKNFVNYNVFRKKYWPSLNDYCKQKFDCELVYSEFSIIKGTNPEVDFLSREEYRDISTKKYPAFYYKRDQIYDLFLHYEKKKARNQDYDLMDRTLAIYRYAKKKALGSLHIHEVYIDECQDNHIVDLALILKVFERANNIFLAGDIAQCIAKGSSFRFQDLRALMYRWELTRMQTKHHDVIKPKQFYLNINYRSHDGILQLAASVIDLIHEFFPNSIDEMARERAEIGGPLPTIYNRFHNEYFKNFSATDKNQSSLIEFGAYQVIIVRDDEAKLRLKKLIGKGAMVMTVYDAKGMEFNDVLLYNFFTDSPALRKWRVILSLLKENSEGIQTFTHEKHFILSSELKQLYVAVTRAKQRLWICDENTEFSMPIRKYWKHHGLIKECQSMDEIILSTLAKKSDSREWNKQGIEFFEQRQYEQAIFCFEKSGNEESRKLANAYYLRQIAKESINDSDEEDIKSKFICAAIAFNRCSRPTQAALCYQDISMYKEAGDVYAKHDMFEPAARNYIKANMWHDAGKCFEKATKYDDAALAFKDGRLYEIAANFILRCKQQIENKTFRQVADCIKDDYHSNAISYGKYDEAVDMYKRLIDDNNGEDISKTLEFILYICRIDMLKETIIGITSHNTFQKYLIKAKEFIMEFEPRLTSKSKKWSNLIDEFNLYSAYLDKDVDKVYKCIRFFRRHKEIATEFHAINIWLQILTQSSDIQGKLHHERLLCLQRICELAFPYIKTINSKNSDQNKENFENIFCIRKVSSNLQKRQIPSGNPLLQSHFVNDMHKSKIEDVEEKRNDQHIYDVNDVHERILKCLIPHIFEHVQNADQKGRDIPDISYQICYKFTSCRESSCQRHHVIPTTSILYQRLILVRLQYTVITNVNVLENLHNEQIKELRNRRLNNNKQIKKLKDDLLNNEQTRKLENQIKKLEDHLLHIEEQIEKLENHRLLVNEQIKKFHNLQKWWAERLVKIHIRYQSPQISCPEITHKVLTNFPEYTRKIFIDYARKAWLVDSKNVNNFEVILKCMFIFQRLQGRHGIDKFTLEMTKTRNILHPKDLPIGFEYYNGHNKAKPVGNRLSSFFFQLYLNNVKSAILNIRIFIQYAIDNTQFVNIVTFDAFNDLVSLIEFTTSLIFTIKPGYCDFCIPRGFLVNYFEAFTVEPLIPNNRHNHDRKNYLDMIKNSFEQVQQLLNLLIYEEHFYLSIILRLIRLLILICLNEPNYGTKIKIFFKYLNQRVFSTKIKKYLENKSMEQLINLLCNDLNETGCDSLVIVHYYVKHTKVLSKFSNLEKIGIKKLIYKSTEEFHSALQQIKSSVNIQEEDTILNKLQGRFSQIRDLESQKAIIKIQDWYRKIRIIKAAKKIQVWIRRVHKRIKLRQDYDQIQNKIYNDVMAFSKVLAKEINKESVSKYNILLRGQAVDVVVKLINQYKRMKAFINNCSRNSNRSDYCLKLEDELRNHHYKKVKQVLRLLSITENSEKHKEIDIEWLKNELQQAKDVINQIHKWVVKYRSEINPSYNNSNTSSHQVVRSSGSASISRSPEYDDWIVL